MLQRAATLCNMLHHAVAHYSTLQNTAAHLERATGMCVVCDQVLCSFMCVTRLNNVCDMLYADDIDIDIDIDIEMCIHLCLHACVRICVCICIHVCVYVYIFIASI